MEDIATKIALIGILGIAAQWLAWRFHLPAIVLLAGAGILAGPVLGVLDPRANFGDILQPAIGLAVAVILFEGGLTLNFAEIKETGKAVKRLVLVSAPIAWALGALSAHYVAGLTWPAALILTGIFVVTGPTVIMPLLRNAKLDSRPSALLRWEAIVADPVGALFAVIAFELYMVFGVTPAHHSITELLTVMAIALPLGILGGWYLGKLMAMIFIRGYVPEFLKAPVLLVVVLAAYVATNHVLEETGLLTVTAMGIAMGNSRIASLSEMRRFKEVITVLLVSALFIILTATLKLETLTSLGLNDIAFIAMLLFIVRPASIWISTIGTGLTWQERTLMGWIAPRGIVAVAVAGLFGALLIDLGSPDGERMIALTFAVVFTTVILHGFTLGPLGKYLDLASHDKPGILFVGGTNFTTTLAKELKELNIPVRIADSNFSHLKQARLSSIPVFFGEILSETRQYRLDLHGYSHMIAATDNDSYNALVCTELAHEFGRSNVIQLASDTEERHENRSMSFTLGGRRMFDEPIDAYALRRNLFNGWQIQTTAITDEYTHENYMANKHPDTLVIAVLSNNQTLDFVTENNTPIAQSGNKLIAFTPPPSNK